MREEDLFDWDWVQAHRRDSWPRLTCQWIAQRAARAPHDIVVSDGERSWTAEELALYAGGVAAQLLEEGTTKPVVLFVDRSLASVAGVSGVHWSGRCLIPVDVGDPVDRLADIVARVGECTLADATGRGPTMLGARTVLDVSHVVPTRVDQVPMCGDDPALVVFTSGSSGRPKGVIRSGWQFDVGALRRRGEVQPSSRTALLLPVHWVGGLSALMHGVASGFVLLVNPVGQSVAHLVEDMRAHSIDHSVMTPSLAEMLRGALHNGIAVETLKRVIFVGEAPTLSSIAGARALGAGDVTVHTVYGASEGLGEVVGYDFGPHDLLEEGKLPMGTPNEDLVRLEPSGDPDDGLYEIVLQRWVGHGYWGDPESTAEKFGTDAHGDPFWRSGDLVEIDDDGLLWAAGRADDVVKIAGKLVSPSESAAVLSQCSGVRRAFVLPRTLESGRKQLIGHVEVDSDADPRKIRAELEEKLPTHLIPAVFVEHDRLPMGTAGKIDRRRLLTSEIVPWRADSPVAPRTEVERLVVDEAGKMLGVPTLGVDDDLWTFGLDSLGAIELTEVLARQVGVRVDVNDFIGASTPAQVAALLSGDVAPSSSQIVDFGLGDSGRTVFLIAGAGSPAMTMRSVAVELAPSMHAFGIEQRVFEGVGEMTIRAAAMRSIEEVRGVEPTGPYRLVGYSWGGLVAHEMAHVLRAAGEDVSVVMVDTGNPAVRQSREWRGMVIPLGRDLPRWVRRVVHRPAVFVRQYVGSGREFWRGFRVAVRAMRSHRPRVFGGPVLVIETNQSGCGRWWADEPQVQVVRVDGEHDQLILSPYVAAVGRVITDFFDSL